MDSWLKEDETLDDLIHDNLKVIQKKNSFRFSVDAVLLANFVRIKSGEQVVDLGSGTGVMPLLLAAKTPASKIIGVEIQPDFFEMSERSVALNNLTDRIKMLNGDLKDILSLLPAATFEVVISNPPYNPLGRGMMTPVVSRAIAMHEIECTLDDVVKAASFLLNSQGKFAMVHRPYRLADILTTLRKYSLEAKRLRLVYPRPGESANLVLIEAMKKGGPDLEVLPPLIIYNEKGEYSKEVREIYFGPFGK